MLPVELLLAIARLLPAHDLTRLALAASSLCHVARAVLYRHLSLSRRLSLVPLLARRPHIARNVRSLYIALDALDPVFPSFYRLVSRALANMVHLRSLHLLVDSSLSAILPSDASLPALVHLTCTFPLDHHVVRFLHNTPALLELEVDSIPSVSPCPAPLPPLPPSLVPRLEQFIGSAPAAALIVPGRPVQSIHLSGSSLSDDHIPLLARASAPVLALAAVTNSPPVPFLQLLRRHLPHLAYLRVMSTQNLFQPPDPDFYKQVADVLASFSHLDAFELSGVHWGSQRRLDDDKKRVWQSSPISSSSLPSDDLLLLAY